MTTTEQALDLATDLLWTDNDLKDIIPVLKAGKDLYDTGKDSDLSAYEYLEDLSNQFHAASDFVRSAGFIDLADLFYRMDTKLRKLAMVGHRGAQEVVVDINNLWAVARDELAKQEAKL